MNLLIDYASSSIFSCLVIHLPKAVSCREHSLSRLFVCLILWVELIRLHLLLTVEVQVSNSKCKTLPFTVLHLSFLHHPYISFMTTCHSKHRFRTRALIGFKFKSAHWHCSGCHIHVGNVRMQPVHQLFECAFILEDYVVSLYDLKVPMRLIIVPMFNVYNARRAFPACFSSACRLLHTAPTWNGRFLCSVPEVQWTWHF